MTEAKHKVIFTQEDLCEILGEAATKRLGPNAFKNGDRVQVGLGLDLDKLKANHEIELVVVFEVQAPKIKLAKVLPFKRGA